MLEDYVAGAVLLAAAFAWARKLNGAGLYMAAAWAYVTGGMFVPLFAHLEAWLREETFRADHIHTDTNAIILKGTVWVICLVSLIIALRHAHSAGKKADKTR